MDLQSKLESHQPEHTMNYLAAAGKKLVNTPLLLPCGARAPRLPREGKGEHQRPDRAPPGRRTSLKKGKNGNSVGDTETNVKTNHDYTVRLFALAFTDRCNEQVKVKHHLADRKDLEEDARDHVRDRHGARHETKGKWGIPNRPKQQIPFAKRRKR